MNCCSGDLLSRVDAVVAGGDELELQLLVARVVEHPRAAIVELHRETAV